MYRFSLYCVEGQVAASYDTVSISKIRNCRQEHVREEWGVEVGCMIIIVSVS